MTSGMKTILYPVKDLDAAKKLYGALFGVAPVMDAPYSSATTSMAKTSVSTLTATAKA